MGRLVFLFCKFTLTFLLFIAHLCAQAPDFKFEQITIENGLPANTVLSIFQDSKGFLWVGTYDGLCRFDGYTFKIFKNNPHDSTSIAGNRIQDIYEDKSGIIWIATQGYGLNKYDPNKETFDRYQHNPNDSTSISADEVFSVCEDDSGNLWIATSHGLNCYNKSTANFARYYYDPQNLNSLSSNDLSSLLYDNDTLWIGSRTGGLICYKISTNKFLRFQHANDDPYSISDNQILSLYKDRNDILWVGSFKGGLNKFIDGKFINYKHDIAQPESISNDGILSITEDQKGRLLIGTYDGGLNYFDREHEKFYSYKNDNRNPGSISDNLVHTILCDKTGIIWLGTWSGGINKINTNLEKFKHYSHDDNNKGSLSNNSVYAILKDVNGVLWIGTDAGGVNRLNPGTNSFIHYMNEPGNPRSISSNGVFSIIQDRERNIWFGTESYGLNLYNPKEDSFIKFRNDQSDPNSLSSDRISTIYEDRHGNLYIGTFLGGLNKYNKDTRTFSKVIFSKKYASSLHTVGVFSIFRDRKDVLWVGSYNEGLFMLDEKNHKDTLYKHNPGDIYSISDDIISCIYEDRAGNLWIGTYNGLNKYLRNSEKFVRLNSSDGLPNNVIYAIEEDSDGNLWISTNNGISRFNPVNFSIKNYSRGDGLQSDEFNQWASFKDKDGNLYFGGINGVTVFHPDSLKSNTNKPNIVLTDFKLLHKSVSVGMSRLFNRVVLKKSILFTEELRLDYDENIITFEFSSLDFHNPRKNRYRYFLEGFDKEWHEVNYNNRTATYTNLDPGKYIFRVIGSNYDDVWNYEGTRLSLIINPPWWRSWWAYLIYLLILILIFLTSTKFYLNRQRLKNQLILEHEHAVKMDEISRLKSRFFTNISHEFRTPLTLIKGPAENILDASNDPKIRKNALMIKRNAKRMLSLINQLLNLSRIDAGSLKIKAAYDNIIIPVRNIAMSFKSLADIKNIDYKIITGNKPVEIYFDREIIEEVLENLLSNAFKYTPNGKQIIVSLDKKNEKEVLIKIRNTGVGITEEQKLKIFNRFYQISENNAAEQEGSGIGLSIVKELIQIHHGSISVDSVPGEFVEFTIVLPTGTDHLKPVEIADNREVKKTEAVPTRDLIENFPDDEPHAESETDKDHILIVEDNPELRVFIKDSLYDQFIFSEAENGIEGLKMAREIIPDIIISDIMMPQLDGIQMTRKLKNENATCHIPIILLTAKSGQKNKIEGLQTGADEYLTKPFDKKELLIRIQNLINVRKVLQQKLTSEEFIERKTPGRVSVIAGIDAEFMRRILSVIEQHLAEEEFTIEGFGREVGLSRSQLHRKLKALTGKSASQYLRSVRLAKARKKLENKEATVSEIAYSVGFNSPSYFAKCFKEEYGYTPSELTADERSP